MFSNLNWYNVLLLLLLALFIFGDKLPQMLSDGLRMLRNLRRAAQNAASDLSREFGTDISLEDLNPRTFVRKHLLSEDEQEALLRPFKTVSDDLRRHTSDLQREWDEIGQPIGTGGSGSPAAGKGRAASPPVRDNGAGPPVSAGPGAAAVRGDGADPAAGAGPAAPRPWYDDIT